jgi:hypothetical protein
MGRVLANVTADRIFFRHRPEQCRQHESEILRSQAAWLVANQCSYRVEGRRSVGPVNAQMRRSAACQANAPQKTIFQPWAELSRISVVQLWQGTANALGSGETAWGLNRRAANNDGALNSRLKLSRSRPAG